MSIHGSIFSSPEFKAAIGQAFYHLLLDGCQDLSDWQGGQLDEAAHFYGLFRPNSNAELPTMIPTVEDVGQALDFLKQIKYRAHS